MSDFDAKFGHLTTKEQSVLAKLDRSGDCWIWTGALTQGRGRAYWRGRNRLHYRVVFEILVGPIPEGALICHHCDNPACANPDHLYAGDAKTNAQDMVARNRHWTKKNPEKARLLGQYIGKTYGKRSRGAKHGATKLDDQKVAAIRADDRPHTWTAKQYGVSETTIRRIRKMQSWV